MYVHRALLLIFLVLYIFTPTIQAWIVEGGSAWYRPYIAWGAIIFFVYLIQLRARTNSYEA